MPEISTRGGGAADSVCPSWCVAEHSEEQHPDDRWHESANTTVPVVELRTLLIGEQFHYRTVAQELDVRLEQRVEQAEAFLTVGHGEERERNFRLSVESVERLVRAMGAAVRLAQQRDS